MTEQVSVVDLVSEPRYNAMFELSSFLRADKIADLAPWVPVIQAMMQLPPQLMKEVGIGIVQRFFEEECINDPRDAEPFAMVLANSIQMAAQMIFQQMQNEAVRQQQTRQKLASGLLGS